MSRSEEEVMLSVHKKLRGEGKNEWFAAFSTLTTMLILVFAWQAVDGLLAWGIGYLLFLYFVAIGSKIAGWKTVIITTDEQEWLKQNFPKKERL